MDNNHRQSGKTKFKVRISDCAGDSLSFVNYSNFILLFFAFLQLTRTLFEKSSEQIDHLLALLTHSFALFKYFFTLQ